MMKLKLGIRQRFVLDEANDDRGNPIPLERLRPMGHRWDYDEGEMEPVLYTHDSLQLGYGWGDVERCGYWEFLLTTAIDLDMSDVMSMFATKPSDSEDIDSIRTQVHARGNF